ncbi:hypothetical protein GCM10010182_32310 [Actinomadura cremea]|nr:hypothetical protein GCM10010182_32310 [Actinomadura cremea]
MTTPPRNHRSTDGRAADHGADGLTGRAQGVLLDPSGPRRRRSGHVTAAAQCLCRAFPARQHARFHQRGDTPSGRHQAGGGQEPPPRYAAHAVAPLETSPK